MGTGRYCAKLRTVLMPSSGFISVVLRVENSFFVGIQHTWSAFLLPRSRHKKTAQLCVASLLELLTPLLPVRVIPGDFFSVTVDGFYVMRTRIRADFACFGTFGSSYAYVPLLDGAHGDRHTCVGLCGIWYQSRMCFEILPAHFTLHSSHSLTCFRA